jgi:hypothetical protein
MSIQIMTRSNSQFNRFNLTDSQTPDMKNMNSDGYNFFLPLSNLNYSVADPVTFYPKDPGSRIIFFSGSRILTTSQIQDFTIKNGEKQEKLNV